MSRIKVMGAALVLATLAVVSLSAPATAFDCQGSCWGCNVPNGGTRCVGPYTGGWLLKCTNGNMTMDGTRCFP
jgi:hypothetical protein